MCIWNFFPILTRCNKVAYIDASLLYHEVHRLLKSAISRLPRLYVSLSIKFKEGGEWGRLAKDDDIVKFYEDISL